MPAAAHDTSLILTDVAVARGGLVRLSGVGLEAAPGQVVGLRGPNGIGKTTLLRAIAGLQPLVAGQVNPGRDAVAYASHADGIKATLTVAENLRFWAAVYGAADIGPAVAAFDLDGLLDRAGGSLSAGQARRCGLARLVLSGRSVWLLDEPTVALDTAGIAQLGALLEAHCAAGGVALVSSHAALPVEDRTLDLTGYASGQGAATPMAATAFDEAVE
ncbi:MAG: heme ABC exporter ATP-binding protein CcmA [Pseudomonadota bacterium]